MMFGFGEKVLNNLTQYYQNQISDETIKVFEASGAWGGPIFDLGYDGMVLAIFKNDALYDIRDNRMEVICKITIPSNIGNTESDYINYALPLVKDYWKRFCEIKGIDFNDNITLQKGAEELHYDENGQQITTSFDDGYTIFANGGKIGLVQLKKEEGSNIQVEDKENGIKLETTTDIVPSDTILEIKPIEKSNITVLEDTANNFVAYDITLKSNGVEIQPNGNVKISIPVPENFDTSRLVVYRIEEDGTKVEYKVNVVTIDGKQYAQFETDHFSIYALVELANSAETNQPVNNDNDKGELDDTPKTGTIDIIYYIIPITLISAVGIVVLGKKKETK